MIRGPLAVFALAGVPVVFNNQYLGSLPPPSSKTEVTNSSKVPMSCSCLVSSEKNSTFSTSPLLSVLYSTTEYLELGLLIAQIFEEILCTLQ